MSNFQQQKISHNLWFVIKTTEPFNIKVRGFNKFSSISILFTECKIYHWFVKIWTKTKEHYQTSTYPSPWGRYIWLQPPWKPRCRNFVWNMTIGKVWILRLSHPSLWRPLEKYHYIKKVKHINSLHSSHYTYHW